MSRGNCSPGTRERCPFSGRECFTDEHHLAYPRKDYRTPSEKIWRGLSFNKIDLPRCVHDAIHASGYIPTKPDRSVMFDEIDRNDTEHPSLRSMVEREHQLMLGRAALENEDGNAA